MHWEGLLLLMEELLRKALIFVSGWFPSLLFILSLHVRFMFISKSVFVVVYVFICASVSSSHHLPSGPVWPFLHTRLADPKMEMMKSLICHWPPLAALASSKGSPRGETSIFITHPLTHPQKEAASNAYSDLYMDGRTTLDGS